MIGRFKRFIKRKINKKYSILHELSNTLKDMERLNVGDDIMSFSDTKIRIRPEVFLSVYDEYKMEDVSEYNYVVYNKLDNGIIIFSFMDLYSLSDTHGYILPYKEDKFKTILDLSDLIFRMRARNILFDIAKDCTEDGTKFQIIVDKVTFSDVFKSFSRKDHDGVMELYYDMENNVRVRSFINLL